MGILDFIKDIADDRPQYEVTGIDFGEGDGTVKPSRFSSEISLNTRYVYARLRVKVNRPFEELWMVRILGPAGKMLQGDGIAQGYAGRFRCRFPQSGEFHMLLPVGNAKGDMFTHIGSYGWVLCKQDGTPVKSALFHIIPVEDRQRRQGYMRIRSVEFANVGKDSKPLVPFAEASKADLRTDTLYLQGRVKYYGICSAPQKIKLDIEIASPKGKVSSFDAQVTVNAGESVLTLPGWGNERGTSYYTPGDYEYRILFEDNILYSTTLSIKRSLRDEGNLKVLSLTLHKESEADFIDFLKYHGKAIQQPELVVARGEGLCPVVSLLYYPESQKTLLLKVTDPFGNLLHHKDSPPGYTMIMSRKCGNSVPQEGDSEIDFFNIFNMTADSGFVEGEYRLSLFVRNFRGDDVCLYVTRVKVRKA